MQASACHLGVRSSVLLLVVAVRRLSALLALLGALATATLAHAQESASTKLSAQEFLARVGKFHPSLELLEAAVDEASANVRAAGLWANPALSYSREEVFPGGRGQPENYLLLELPLEISGRRGLRVEGAEYGLDAAKATSARDRATLLYDAMVVYWSAATAQQTLETLRQERETLRQRVEALRSRTRAGDTSGYDLDRLELEVDSLEDLTIDAERDVERWQRRLGLLVGAPGTRVEAGDALALPSPPPSIDGLMEEALANREDYKAARLRVAQAGREVKAAGRGWVPTFVLTGGAKSSTIEPPTTAWGYVAGLSLSVPVFDYGQGEATRGRARLRQAEAEQRLIEAQVRTEVMTAYGELTRSREQAERHERTQVPRLERLVRRAQLSYQEGERPVFELLDSLRTARSVRVRSLELKRDVRRSELDLWRALGRRP